MLDPQPYRPKYERHAVVPNPCRTVLIALNLGTWLQGLMLRVIKAAVLGL